MSFPDDRKEAPLTEKDQQELRRILLHQLTVIEAAFRHLEELRGGPPSPPIDDELGNKEP